MTDFNQPFTAVGFALASVLDHFHRTGTLPTLEGLEEMLDSVVYDGPELKPETRAAMLAILDGINSFSFGNPGESNSI